MTRFVWLHGFASGPTSSKGQFVRARLAERGIELQIPDLNQPSFLDLTVSRMLAQLDALAGSGDGLILFGSSLGGFTAATWAGTRRGRTAALILLAPAFDLAPRWEKSMGREAAVWRADGRYAFDHHGRGRKEELGIGFLDDARTHASFPLPRCPTLVIQGTLDDTVDPSLAREFASRMDGRAQLVEVGEGHQLTADLPGLWRRIEQFLQPWLPRPTP
jgi:pimeloyl-ACP methyl ester carboxylesterase